MATVAWLLISPAALFMVALVVRAIQPQLFEPAHSAQRVIMWFAGRRWTLLVLLIALPLLVLAAGGATLLEVWRDDPQLKQGTREALAWARAHLTTLLLAAATLIAAGILSVVAVHMLTD
jgi:hypothetical protein